MFSLTSWFSGMPHAVALFLLAIIPVAERVAVPIGIGAYHLPWWEVYIVVVAGNAVPIIIVFWLLDCVCRFLTKRSHIMERLFAWWFAHVQKKFSAHYAAYGLYALILLAAIPLPITGSWTAATAAWLFRLPRWRSAGYIMIGVLIASALLTAGTMGAISFRARMR